MSKSNIEIRPYKDSDVKHLASIYYNTIHLINARDYSQDQINVWAPQSSLDAISWKKKWEKLKPLVAICNNEIVGFAEFEPNGHIDCFYCHHEWIGEGVGSALMKEIEQTAHSLSLNRIYAEVSITAKPFFIAKGFSVVKKQIVEKKGIKLENFIMEKFL